MAPLAIALFLFLQSQPAAGPPPAPDAAPPAEAAPAQERWPAGAPHDDYQFVAWCYGTLRGYLDLHDQVMPEVTRIESTYRQPGHKLADDLKVYADIQKDGERQLKIFRAAITAAEKASMQPINTVGAAAVQQGRSTWNAGPEITKARLAQEWMSWALPARCETTAKTLEARASLLGASFKANVEPAGATPTPAPAPPPEQPAGASPN